MGQELLAENGFWHEIATKPPKVILGHSCCNQSQAKKGWHIVI